MSRYFLTFSKQGMIRFTSHLDMLRLFERAFKRASIPLEYSRGYNPHPRMSFAQPLPLGYSACAEVLEFRTDCVQGPGDMLCRLRAEMPFGLYINSCASLDYEGAPKTLGGAVEAADYQIFFSPEEGPELAATADACSCLMKSGSLIVRKPARKNCRSGRSSETDIRGKIRELEAASLCGATVILARLDCGSRSNLSPELLIDALRRVLPELPLRGRLRVQRKALIFRACNPQTSGISFTHDVTADRGERNEEQKNK